MGFYKKIIFGYHTYKKNQLFLLTVDIESDGKITSDLLINHLIILKSIIKKIFDYKRMIGCLNLFQYN